MADTIINTVWIGKEIGPIHAACLRSMLKYGHDVVLHAFGKPVDIPKGVRLFDASKLMSEKEIVHHKETGSLTLASDIYRYRILREGMGIYADCDMYFVDRVDYSEYIFGYEYLDKFNNAILNMPHDSDLLISIMKGSEDPYFIPPWRKRKKRIIEAGLKKIGMGRHVSNREWGTIGPDLVTYYVKDHDLVSLASQVDIYYPLHPDHVPLLWSKGLTVADLKTPNTKAIHLYKSVMDKHRKDVLSDTPLYEIINS